MPTFFFYKGGAEVDQLVGASSAKLEEKVKALAQGLWLILIYISTSGLKLYWGFLFLNLIPKIYLFIFKILFKIRYW